MGEKKQSRIKKALSALLSTLLLGTSVCSTMPTALAASTNFDYSGSTSIATGSEFLKDNGSHSQFDNYDPAFTLSGENMQYANRPQWDGQSKAEPFGSVTTLKNVTDSKGTQFPYVFEITRNTPGKCGVLYKNLKYWDMKQDKYIRIDVKVVIDGWSQGTSTWERTANAPFVALERRADPVPAIDTVGLYTADIHHYFYEAGTTNPITLKTNVTYTDIDDLQGFAIKADKVLKQMGSKHSKLNYKNANGYRLVHDIEGVGVAGNEDPLYSYGICYESDEYAFTWINAHIQDRVFRDTDLFQGTGDAAGMNALEYAFTTQALCCTNAWRMLDTEIPAPTKTVSDEDETDVKKNTIPTRDDQFVYTIKQRIPPGNSPTYYFNSFQMTDTLDTCLEVVSKDEVKVFADDKDVTDKFNIAVDGTKVTASAKPSYRQTDDFYGHTYYLKIRARIRPTVTEAEMSAHNHYDTERKTLTFTNTGKTIIVKSDKAQQERIVQDTNEVSTVIAVPKMEITKDVSKYEWMENDLVDYTIQVNQVNTAATAHDVVILDNDLPQGLEIQEDTLKATGINRPYTLEKVAGGFKFTTEKMTSDDHVVITFKALALDKVNGKQIPNVASVDVWGQPPEEADEEIYVNTARLTLDKNASKYEWRAGDDVDYTVTVKSSGDDGTIARNVVISDISLPEGLKLNQGNDAIKLTGVPATIQNPIKGGFETKNVSTSIKRTGTGWTVNISDLPKGETAKITFKCRATEDVNGNEIINTAKTSCDNLDTNDTRNKLEDTETVWINSPRLKIEKTADKKTVKVGDIVTYTINVWNTQTGTVARNVTVEDIIDTEGVKLQKNSIVLMDEEGNKINEGSNADNCKITVKNNTFKVETFRTLIHPENYTIIDNENGGNLLQDKYNPLSITNQTKMTVEYQVVVVDPELAGKDVHNTAVVSSDENIPVDDEEIVTPNTPDLSIQKTSDKASYMVGETGKYTVTVRQTREDVVAKQVVIEDIMSDTGAEIQADSIQMKMNGEAFTPKSIEATTSGYTIHTGKDMMDSDSLVITYNVLFKDDTLVGKNVINTVKTFADNTPAKKTDNEVTVYEHEDIKDNPAKLTMEKISDKEEYHVGDTGTYTLTIRQTEKDATAENVVIEDTFADKGMTIDAESIVVTLDGSDITAQCDIDAEETSFVINTHQNISEANELQVTYNVTFNDAALANTTVQNTAITAADNTDPSQDDNKVQLLQEMAVLKIKKTSDKDNFKVGDIGKYTLTVTQTEEDVVAKNVVIEDAFAVKGMKIDLDSIKVTLDKKDITEDCEITGDKTSFTIKTNKDLAYGEKMKVTYDVTFESKDLLGQAVVNTAKTYGDNAEETTVDYEVELPDDTDQEPDDLGDDDGVDPVINSQNGKVQTGDTGMKFLIPCVVIGGTALVVGGIVTGLIFRKRKNMK